MQWINELTDQEIMSLSDEQVIAMVKRKCAEEGVKILENPEEPIAIQIQPELMLYQVGSYFFENSADADAAVLVLVKAFEQQYDYSTGYHYKFPKRIDGSGLSVEPTKMFSKKQIDSYRDELVAYKEAQERHSELSKEYKESLSHREQFVDEIWSKVREVRAKYDKLNSMRSQYREYIVIGNGDEQLAWQFFVKAYGEQNEQDKAYICTK